MNARPSAFLVLAAALAAALPAGRGSPAGAAQFTAAELDQRPRWEAFLANARVIESESRQMKSAEAVTSPWVLMLELDGVKHRGLWKNPEGRMGGYWEGWQYEIAAYRLDKLLGLGLVPPTVERRFRDVRGSCQYWVDDCISLRDKEEKGTKIPPQKVQGWNRATYLQRLFDNLIANEDRHQNQVLITPDWRMVLIDHSRSFRTSGRFTKSLLFSARSPDGPKLMSELPRALVGRLKALDAAAVRAAVGGTLTEDEVRAVIVRRDLILAEIDRLVQVNGEDRVFY